MKKIEEVIFKPIPGFEDYYVSNTCEVINMKTKEFLKPSWNQEIGCHTVTLSKNGVKHTYCVAGIKIMLHPHDFIPVRGDLGIHIEFRDYSGLDYSNEECLRWLEISEKTEE